MKEYGSSVQKLVDYILTIDDQEKRTKYAYILVELMKQIHPGMKDNSQDYYKKLWDDLYIMSQPPQDMALQDEVFLGNPLIPIAALGHPLTKKNHLTLAQLSKQRFILREKGSGTRMMADKFFKKHRFKADIRMELGSNEAIKEAVAAGLGIGIISKHALHGLLKSNGVTQLQVTGFPISSYWHIVHPAKKQLPPIAVAFKEHLLSSLSKEKLSSSF